MKKLILALGLTIISTIGFGQSDGIVVRRIKIRSADPQLIFMLLSGTANFQTPPEISTTQFRFGGNGGFGNSGFGGGNNNFGGNGGFGNGFGASGIGNKPLG